MDNPWTSAWDNHTGHPQEADIAWSAADTTPQWPATRGTVWLQGVTPWDSSTTVQSQDMTSEQDITQDQRGFSQLSSPSVLEPSCATGASVSDNQVARLASPPRGAFYSAPEISDATLHNIASVAHASDEENIEVAFNPSGDDWGVAWGTIPSPEANPKETQPPDRWEVARQEKEKFNRAVVRHLYQRTLHLIP